MHLSWICELLQKKSQCDSSHWGHWIETTSTGNMVDDPARRVLTQRGCLSNGNKKWSLSSLHNKKTSEFKWHIILSGSCSRTEQRANPKKSSLYQSVGSSILIEDPTLWCQIHSGIPLPGKTILNAIFSNNFCIKTGEVVREETEAVEDTIMWKSLYFIPLITTGLVLNWFGAIIE